MSRTLMKQRDEEKKTIAIAIIKTLAQEVLAYNERDALQSLKSMWKDGVLQKFVDDIPEIKELMRRGLLP